MIHAALPLDNQHESTGKLKTLWWGDRPVHMRHTGTTRATARLRKVCSPQDSKFHGAAGQRPERDVRLGIVFGMRADAVMGRRAVERGRGHSDAPLQASLLP